MFGIETPALLSVKTFGELFEGAKKWTHQPGAKTPLFQAGRVVVSSYLMHSTAGGPRHPSMEVRPTPVVLAVIEKAMLAISRDQIGFEIIDHIDGTSTVYAKYGQIIGSRKLAEIVTTSIPAL